MAVGTVSGLNLDEEWQLIATNSPSSASTSTFTSISGYKKLMLTYALTGVTANLSMRFNGDTADNYGSIALMYTTFNDRATNRILLNAYLDSPNNGYVVINNVNKTMPKIISEIGGVSISNGRGIWVSTDTITEISIFPASGSFSGTVKLYGIAA